MVSELTPSARSLQAGPKGTAPLPLHPASNVLPESGGTTPRTPPPKATFWQEGAGGAGRRGSPHRALKRPQYAMEPPPPQKHCKLTECQLYAEHIAGVPGKQRAAGSRSWEDLGRTWNPRRARFQTLFPHIYSASGALGMELSTAERTSKFATAMPSLSLPCPPHPALSPLTLAVWCPAGCLGELLAGAWGVLLGRCGRCPSSRLPPPPQPIDELEEVISQ